MIGFDARIEKVLHPAGLCQLMEGLGVRWSVKRKASVRERAELVESRHHEPGSGFEGLSTRSYERRWEKLRHGFGGAEIV
jgi:hypothetical protein